ncbi:sushi domain protein [Dictyocaulus viviparus]|uniref:Sushi domain protein n=1 Tax=Dictyocaulus viviparus TaxID=29172 RepID=A0A0D8XR33_DICVI|nr:sushi domain protein [Dictyocaulus viviparus]
MTMATTRAVVVQSEFSGCASAPLPPNGNVSYSSGVKSELVPHGTKAMLNCYAGSKVEGPSLLSCENGSWKPDRFGECKSINASVTAMGCKDMTPRPDTQLIYTSNSIDGMRPMLSTVSLRCDVGETVEGALSAVCIKGQWSPSVLGNCSKDSSLLRQFECSTLIVPPGAELTYSTINTTSSKLKTASLKCFDGSPVNGNNFTTCFLGSWIPSTLGSCQFNGEQHIILRTARDSDITYSTNSTTGIVVMNSTITILKGKNSSMIDETSYSNGNWSQSQVEAWISDSTDPSD